MYSPQNCRALAQFCQRDRERLVSLDKGHAGRHVGCPRGEDRLAERSQVSELREHRRFSKQKLDDMGTGRIVTFSATAACLNAHLKTRRF